MKLAYATTNHYKLQSAQRALAGTNIELVGLSKDTPDIPEIQSDDQEAVAIDKARKYYELLKTPVVVMDSGLFVEAPGGFPGVYTKYVLATVGAEGIAALLAEKPTQSAYTQRTIAYYDGVHLKTFTLKIHGQYI